MESREKNELEPLNRPVVKLNESNKMTVNTKEIENIRTFSKKVNYSPAYRQSFIDKLKKHKNIGIIIFSTAIALSLGIGLYSNFLSPFFEDTINSENTYLYSDNQLILIVNLENTDIEKLTESLEKDYDEETINNALIFDENQISQILNYNDTVTLQNTDWVASKNSDDSLQFNMDIKLPDTEVSAINPINYDEYIIQSNSQGGYDLLLGGVGLSERDCSDLIQELKENGIIPQGAEVTPYINGSSNMPKINKTSIKFTDERLKENYETTYNLNKQYQKTR